MNDPQSGPDHLRVGGAALNQTPLDWPGNRRHILEAINLAREAGVQVLCLPELCVSGYGCEDAFHGEWVSAQAAESLALIAPETRGLAVAVGLPVLHDGALFNGVALVADGAVRGVAAKQVLAGYGVYYEPRWFKAWPAGRHETCQIGAWELPFGDLTFDLGGTVVGFEICEDAWDRDSGRGGAARRGADLVLNPSASHFAFGKRETLQGIVLEGSRQTHAVYVYANLLGNEAGRLIYDGSVLIASDGRLVTAGPRFSYQDVCLTTAIVDLRANRLERRRLSYPFTPGAGERGRVTVPFAPLSPTPDDLRAERKREEVRNPPPSVAADVDEGMPPYEEFAHAVSLGLWDYMRKSRSRGLAVSLSGGVDSSSVAVLGWLMCRFAATDLGVREAARRAGLDTPSNIDRADGQGLVGALVTTVYQSTANSGEITRTAAAGLAAWLGTRHLEWDVEPLAQGYRDLVGDSLGTDWTWEAHDAPLQNIQARVRSPGIWMLANAEGRLLISTSNRSEAGVGYCTMDGDTSGGLAPIAGANKTFLRGWLRWMENEGVGGLGPIPALAGVNALAPTAELRPAGRRQADEDDLMPYPILDAIEQAAIRDRMSPVQVWRRLLTQPLPGESLNPEDAADLVARFFRLWSQSQWKRERLAPSFHLDDENLDPKTWCRFPILSGGYEEELRDLESRSRGAGRSRAEAPAIPSSMFPGRR